MFGFGWLSDGFQRRTSLKIVDGQTMDGRTPADVYTMSLSCQPNDSGGLKRHDVRDDVTVSDG